MSEAKLLLDDSMRALVGLPDASLLSKGVSPVAHAAYNSSLSDLFIFFDLKGWRLRKHFQTRKLATFCYVVEIMGRSVFHASIHPYTSTHPSFLKILATFLYPSPAP